MKASFRTPLIPFAGPLLLAGGAVGVAVAAAALLANPGFGAPGHPEFAVSGAVMAVSDLLVALAITGLAGSPAARPGVLRTIGFGLAIAGSFLALPAEVLLRVNFALGSTLFSVFSPLQALGFVLAGIAIIRTAAWTSWRRFALLALGLYVPAVLVPALIASGGTNLWALGGFHALEAVVGLAALAESRRRELAPA